jgi:hypothetical protein
MHWAALGGTWMACRQGKGGRRLQRRLHRLYAADPHGNGDKTQLQTPVCRGAPKLYA